MSIDELSAAGKKNRTTCATNGHAKSFYVQRNIHFDGVRYTLLAKYQFAERWKRKDTDRQSKS